MIKRDFFKKITFTVNPTLKIRMKKHYYIHKITLILLEASQNFYNLKIFPNYYISSLYNIKKKLSSMMFEFLFLIYGLIDSLNNN